jgi:hypothetical protein
MVGRDFGGSGSRPYSLCDFKDVWAEISLLTLNNNKNQSLWPSL